MKINLDRPYQFGTPVWDAQNKLLCREKTCTAHDLKGMCTIIVIIVKCSSSGAVM